MTRSGPRSVVGVYPDLRTAEKAITALEAHGFDGDDVHLFGDAAERADAIDVSTRDGRIATTVGAGSIVGAVAGALVGALVGLLVGALIGGDLWWVFAVVGAIAVGAYGSVVGAFSRMRASDDWDLSFAPAVGEAAVAVRSTDGARLDEAADALRGAGASRVELH